MQVYPDKETSSNSPSMDGLLGLQHFVALSSEDEAAPPDAPAAAAAAADTAETTAGTTTTDAKPAATEGERHPPTRRRNQVAMAVTTGQQRQTRQRRQLGGGAAAARSNKAAVPAAQAARLAGWRAGWLATYCDGDGAQTAEAADATNAARACNLNADNKATDAATPGAELTGATARGWAEAEAAAERREAATAAAERAADATERRAAAEREEGARRLARRRLRDWPAGSDFEVVEEHFDLDDARASIAELASEEFALRTLDPSRRAAGRRKRGKTLAATADGTNEQATGAYAPGTEGTPTEETNTTARRPASASPAELEAATRRVRARVERDRDADARAACQDEGDPHDPAWTFEVLATRRHEVAADRTKRANTTRRLGVGLQQAKQGGVMPLTLRTRTRPRTAAEATDAVESALAQKVSRCKNEAQLAMTSQAKAARAEEAQAEHEKKRGWTGAEAARLARGAREGVRLLKAGAPLWQVNNAGRGLAELCNDSGRGTGRGKGRGKHRCAGVAVPHLREVRETNLAQQRTSSFSKQLRGANVLEIEDTDSGSERACRGATGATHTTAVDNRHHHRSSSSSSSNDDGNNDSDSSLDSMSSSERRQLTHDVAEGAAKQKQLHARGLRKSPGRKAATAAAAEARRTQRAHSKATEKAAARERQKSANFWLQEGFGLPRQGLPPPSCSVGGPLGESVAYDVEGKCRVYSGRGSLSNQMGVQMDFLPTDM